MKKDTLYWLLVPLCSAFYQASIKMTAGSMAGVDFGSAWLWKAAHEPWMLAAVLSELVAFYAWMKVLSTHDLGKAFVLSASSYVLVLAISWFFFHEPVFSQQIIGALLILCGVRLLGTPNSPEVSS